jgi:hypothetical protein
MPTTRFNANIIEAAARLQAARTSAGVDGDIGAAAKWNSALLTRYQNRAIRDLLKETLQSAGPRGFAEAIPEYMKTSSVLTLIGGIVAKPLDSFFIVELSRSDHSINFYRIPQDQIETVRSGLNANIVPSATHPVFWEESGNIYTLGLPASVLGAGHIYTDSAFVIWTASTKTLSFSLAGAACGYTSADVGKPVMFRTAALTYIGKIESVTLGDPVLVVLSGDGLPVGNIAAPNIKDVISTDLALGNIDVVARYVKTHQDITVSTLALDNGRYYTTAADVAYTAATKTLLITAAFPAGGWVAGDAGRDLVFRTATIVYKGKIVSVSPLGAPERLSIVLSGDGLPSVDVAAPNITGVFTPNISNDDADLKLAQNWDGAIIDKMVAFARADAKAGLV